MGEKEMMIRKEERRQLTGERAINLRKRANSDTYRKGEN